MSYEGQFYIIFRSCFYPPERTEVLIAALALILMLGTILVSGHADERLSSINGIASGVIAAMYIEPLAERLGRLPGWSVPTGLIVLMMFSTIQMKFPDWIGAEATVASHILVKQPLIAFFVLGSV